MKKSKVLKLQENPKKVTLEDLREISVSHTWLKNHPIFLGFFRDLVQMDYIFVDKNGKENYDSDKKNKYPAIYWEVSIFDSIGDILNGVITDSDDLEAWEHFQFISKTVEEGYLKLAKKVYKDFGTYTLKDSEISKTHKQDKFNLPSWSTMKAEREKSIIESKVLLSDIDTILNSPPYVTPDLKYPNLTLDNGYPYIFIHEPFGEALENYEAIKLKLKDTNIKTEYKTKNVDKDNDIS